MTRYHPDEPLLPARDEHVAEWFALSMTTCCASTLKNYFYGLKAAHRTNNLHCPPLSELVRAAETLKGIRRIRRDVVRRVHAISLHDIYLVSLVVRRRAADSSRSVKDKRNDRTTLAAMLVGFYGMLRKSNLTGRMALRRCDMRSDGNVLWLSFHESKVIQHGERVHTVPLVRAGRADLCPVQALIGHVQDCPAGPNASAFRWSTSATVQVDLTHETFTRHMRGMLGEAGLNPAQYTGHSLRRGGATLAFELGASVQDIKRHGDWSSDVVYTYHQVSDSTRCSLPSRMAATAMRC